MGVLAVAARGLRGAGRGTMRTGAWPLARRVDRARSTSLWQAMGGVLERWPGTIWLATVLILSPFAGLAVINYDNVNYGPIQDLPSSAPSVCGDQDSYQTFSRG